VGVNTLERNFEKTVELVKEILLQPRWDEEQFELAKSSSLFSLVRNKANASYLASRTFSTLVYGEDHLLAVPTGGTEESVASITIDDLKEFYTANISPTVARITIAGDIDRERAEVAFSGLVSEWEPREVVLPEIEIPANPERSQVYFVDMPDAKQSVIQIGNIAIPRSHPDFYAAEVVNYKLGGSFNGVLNLILREEKGFTYGARSGFSGNRIAGTFSASSSVRTTATLESVQIFKNEMEKYRKGISSEDLEFTRESLIKSNALRFETLGALQGMLNDISTYNLPFDYPAQEERFLRNLTLEQHQQLAEKYIDPSRMSYVIVGDAATQLDLLKEVGFGAPVLVK
jgi:zinc protease